MKKKHASSQGQRLMVMVSFEKIVLALLSPTKPETLSMVLLSLVIRSRRGISSN